MFCIKLLFWRFYVLTVNCIIYVFIRIASTVHAFNLFLIIFIYKHRCKNCSVCCIISMAAALQQTLFFSRLFHFTLTVFACIQCSLHNHALLAHTLTVCAHRPAQKRCAVTHTAQWKVPATHSLLSQILLYHCRWLPWWQQWSDNITFKLTAVHIFSGLLQIKNRKKCNILNNMQIKTMFLEVHNETNYKKFILTSLGTRFSVVHSVFISTTTNRSKIKDSFRCIHGHKYYTSLTVYECKV